MFDNYDKFIYQILPRYLPRNVSYIKYFSNYMSNMRKTRVQHETHTRGLEWRVRHAGIKRHSDNSHHQFVVGYDSAKIARRGACDLLFLYCYAMRVVASPGRSISSRNTPAVLRTKIFLCEITLVTKSVFI